MWTWKLLPYATSSQHSHTTYRTLHSTIVHKCVYMLYIQAQTYTKPCSPMHHKQKRSHARSWLPKYIGLGWAIIQFVFGFICRVVNYLNVLKMWNVSRFEGYLVKVLKMGEYSGRMKLIINIKFCPVSEHQYLNETTDYINTDKIWRQKSKPIISSLKTKPIEQHIFSLLSRLVNNRFVSEQMNYVQGLISIFVIYSSYWWSKLQEVFQIYEVIRNHYAQQNSANLPINWWLFFQYSMIRIAKKDYFCST